MNRRLEGGCQCGSIRYQVTGELLTLYACHCTECQRQSSSAFGMALWVRHPQIQLNGVAMREWIRPLASGRQMACRFCPDCGTRLFHQMLDQTEIISVKPGTLDDTRWLQPAGHIWTQSAQPWVQHTDGLCYAENPAHFDALQTAWQVQMQATEPRK